MNCCLVFVSLVCYSFTCIAACECASYSDLYLGYLAVCTGHCDVYVHLGAARLVAAMVISRLDYCNSVFIGLPAEQIARLQRVQKIGYSETVHKCREIKER